MSKPNDQRNCAAKQKQATKICQGKDLIAHMKKKKILKSRRRKLKVEHVPQWWRKAITCLYIKNFWDKGKKNKESQQTIKWFHQPASGKNYIHISKMWKQLKLKVIFCKLTTLKVKKDCTKFWKRTSSECRETKKWCLTTYFLTLKSKRSHPAWVVKHCQNGHRQIRLRRLSVQPCLRISLSDLWKS